MATSLLAPFMPETADRISEQLCTGLYDFETLGEFGQFVSGTKVDPDPAILFARLDMKETLEKADKIQTRQKEEFTAHQIKAAKNLAAAGLSTDSIGDSKKDGKADSELDNNENVKPEVTIDDFAKLEFKVGEIIACEAVEKSKKLLCSQVKIGNDIRQIVSGIRKDYSPEQMVGRKVMVITNLKPATLAGVKSEGMILCAEDADGKLSLLTPDNSDIPSGSMIR